MQLWEKIGLLYKNEISTYTHASLPIVIEGKRGIYTIIYSARNGKNQSVPFSLSLDMNKLLICSINESPISLPGSPGEFDADGIMPTCQISHNGLLYLFYIGWNRATDVPFRNSLGILFSKDCGVNFTKKFKGPILDRGIYDPCFVASCDVKKDEKGFSMWYLSAFKWEKSGNKWRHYYNIKYAKSDDLINWSRTGNIAIDFKNSYEYAISSPRVIKDNSGYKMWYSYRGSAANQTYRIGYAESDDGVSWTRKDNEIDLPLSDDGWDSEMICYPYLFEFKSNLYMLYNGNDYGGTGFGLARLRKM